MMGDTDRFLVIYVFDSERGSVHLIEQGVGVDLRGLGSFDTANFQICMIKYHFPWPRQAHYIVNREDYLIVHWCRR